MAIKKVRLLANLTPDQKREFDCLEKQIDNALTGRIGMRFSDGDRVIVPVFGLPPAKVRAELERVYTDAGWKINFEENNREFGSTAIELQ